MWCRSTFVTITAVDGGIKDPSAVTAIQVSPSRRTWPLGSSAHFVDRQASGTDQAAVHTANCGAGAVSGERLADLRPDEDDATRRNSDGNHDLCRALLRAATNATTAAAAAPAAPNIAKNAM